MTMACNLRCKWCSYWIRNRFDTGSMSSMPLDIVVKLASYCSKAGVRGVYFSGGGEPLAYIHIAAATEAFHDAGCELALITNGTLLRRRLLELMNRFTYIQVSLIGTSDGTYVANTGRHGFSEMSALPRAIRERHGSDSPTVGGMYVISDFNYREVPQVVDMARAAGYDYCSFRVAVDFENRDVALSTDARAWLSAYLVGDNYDTIGYTNLRQVLEQMIAAPELSSHCETMDLGLYATVTPDGLVYLCVPDVGRKEFAIGDLTKTLFEDLWGSTRHLKVLEQLHARYRCAGCHTACRGHRYNAALRRPMPAGVASVHAAFL